MLANDAFGVEGPGAQSIAINPEPGNGIVTVDTGATPSDPIDDRVNYLPNENFNGVDSFGYVITDNLGVTSTADVTVTVRAVNDAPSFDSGGDVTTIIDEPYEEPWATNVRAGPPNETDQSVFFIESVVSNPWLFASQPSIDADGVLSFVPRPNRTGTAQISVRAKDNGGTPNDGEDRSESIVFDINVYREIDIVADIASAIEVRPDRMLVIYSAVVFNGGPWGTKEAIVEIDPGQGFSSVNWTCVPLDNADCVAEGSGPILEFIVLPVGGSVLFTLEADANGLEHDIVEAAVSAVATGEFVDANPADNTDSIVTLVPLFAGGFED